ncbi:glycosyltransferase [Rhizobium sp. BK399]|uniref:glycosyltransferase n=1 Tax=Rhizobium sp. BK399 TaxID=2587063 RepID=UPI001609F3F2|nr:glycosyltransferase [Rhizobium sp. BK399]MBB3542445.1 glycosyltransferase involved in cell wall biosynthesis [Rhizobium sp. BK399]
MNPLEELYSTHQGKLSDKWQIYLREYDRLFGEFRFQDINLLEIGVQNGGSLEIWGQYFASAKKIVGCDINEACRALNYDDPRISLVIGDATEENIYQEITNISDAFDVIVDDGSHTSGDIIKTFFRYFSRLKEGGIYVVEDLHCSYWSDFEGGLYHPFSSISFFKRLVDIANYEHWGVDRKRNGYVAGIADHYGIRVDEEILSHVHSVEFINSICVVRKRSYSDNQLGNRICAGDLELVVPGHTTLAGKPHTAPQQAHFWSTLERAPDEVYEYNLYRIDTLTRDLDEAKELHAQQTSAIAARDAMIQEMLSSTSWRITRPLRWLKRRRLLAGRLMSLSCSMFRNRMGLLGAARRANVVYRQGGLRAVRTALARLEGEINAAPRLASPNMIAPLSYSEWVKEYDTPNDRSREEIRKELEQFTNLPKISIVMPTYNSNVKWLGEAIESVRKQIYGNWELCIADDASVDPSVRSLLLQYAEKDDRIKVVLRPENGHISVASNTAIDIATGCWIALLDHDDVLAEHAMSSIVQAINTYPDAGLIYSDEDKLDEKGMRCEPFFKPDWSPHLACSQAYMGHLVAFKIGDAKPKFSVDLNGSQDYDMWLSVASGLRSEQIIHINKILYHWRKHPESTAAVPASKSYADDAGLQAVSSFVQKRYPGRKVQAAKNDWGFTYKLDHAVGDDTKFSIIIPTKDKTDLLSQCVDSILSKTTHKNYEIIVLNNNSEEDETFQYFKEIQQRDRRVLVVDANIEFNWSRLNNIGVQNASGDVFVLLNNDTAVISPDWLQRLGGYALLPDVGVVGALLQFEDGTIQHSGVVVGMGGWADHVYRAARAEHTAGTGFVSPMLTRNVLAVTGACMAISRERYEVLSGFDEEFIICGSDVAICIAAHKMGFFNVLCAEARLYHYESKTRSSFVPEVDFLQSAAKYAPYRVDVTDPFFNRNLSLSSTEVRLEGQPRVS